MEWWLLALIGIGAIGVGIGLGLLPAYLPGRFKTSEAGWPKVIGKGESRKLEAALVQESSKYPLPGLMEEIEANLRIASEPWTGKLLPFQTRMWNDLQSEVTKLPANLQEELSQVYIDVRLANSVVRLSTEFDHTTYDLNQSYTKLRTSIAERLTTVKSLMEGLKGN